MAKKKARQKKEKQEEVEVKIPLNEPWISRRNGFTTIGLLSLVLAVFMAWQLYPTEGLGRAIMFGLGFAVAIWVIFMVSLSFNTWVRRRKGDS
ncbi:MAG: hypothetical protein H6660_04290 [Ardenticatenaceae bacterium]|nr:hypothetical protein [Ardenticatenaceae bacterium]